MEELRLLSKKLKKSLVFRWLTGNPPLIFRKNGPNRKITGISPLIYLKPRPHIKKRQSLWESLFLTMITSQQRNACLLHPSLQRSRKRKCSQDAYFDSLGSMHAPIRLNQG